ncbi:short-chain dehydrogenase [Nitzschia inconspicua]|uniref:Short-chain dehydrogenase n=1 Tax=Nitzschia inconspicua TaxID=303405 RepID=A0A9K3LIN4_9STRA|nr:short-chain dehydrogenase [Nitzschia inconspicua]
MNETISNSPHQWNTQELPVVVIAGYGPSIGESTARQFGSKGYAIACLGRTQNKLLDSVQELKASKITAAAFVTDCGDTRSVKEAIQQVQSHLGRISVIVWNAASYVGSDLVSGNDDPSEILNQIVGVGCAGLLASIQEAYEDLKATKGTILITGGGLSGYDQKVNQIAVNNSWMGLAFCKSSQRKLAGLLHARLKPDGVMVGTVIISGAVRVGGGLDVTDPDDVATAFWEIHQSRHKQEVHLGSLT